jgi:hypothetical protein
MPKVEDVALTRSTLECKHFLGPVYLTPGLGIHEEIKTPNEVLKTVKWKSWNSFSNWLMANRHKAMVFYFFYYYYYYFLKILTQTDHSQNSSWVWNFKGQEKSKKINPR